MSVSVSKPARPNDSRRVIDEIIYLATLVSQPRQIDHLLDKVRSITSRLRLNEQFTDAEARTLRATHREIEQYLLEQEPVRAFTPETLQQQLYEHFEGRQAIKRLHQLLAAVTAGITLIVGASAVLPTMLPSAERVTFAIDTALVLIYLTGALLFVVSLKTFSPEVRRGYWMVAVGFGVTALALLQVPFMELNHKIFDIGWNLERDALYTLAFGLIYYGIRRVAAILQLKKWSSSLGLLATVTIAGYVIAAVLPHAPAHGTELAFDIDASYTLGAAIIIGFTTHLAYGIWRNTTPLYAGAMKWFFWALAITTFSSVELLLVNLASGRVNGAGAPLAAVPFLMGLALFVRSSYAFSKIGRI